MKTPNLTPPHPAKLPKWFRRRRRAHDRMLVLNMSIFNSGKAWDRIFNPITYRENVWA